MKKIPTLFKRIYKDHKVIGITQEITEGCEPVLQGIATPTVIGHGQFVILQPLDNYEDIRKYLQEHAIEGIVYWYNGSPLCKIKRSDFGFKWPVTQREIDEGDEA